jgi:hypothetical protein
MTKAQFEKVNFKGLKKLQEAGIYLLTQRLAAGRDIDPNYIDAITILNQAADRVWGKR